MQLYRHNDFIDIWAFLKRFPTAWYFGANGLEAICHFGAETLGRLLAHGGKTALAPSAGKLNLQTGTGCSAFFRFLFDPLGLRLGS